MKKMNKKGFTIVELTIVIAVIAILAAVLIPTFTGVVNKAKESAALQEVKAAYTATLSEDLATPETNDDAVYNQGEIVVMQNNIKIIISAEGSARVAGNDDTSKQVTHVLSGGKLVKSN